MANNLNNSLRILALTLLLGSLSLLATSCGSGGSFPSTPSPEPSSNPSPAISGVQPSFVVAGNQQVTITISGTGFEAGTSLSFNGRPHVITFINSRQITTVLDSSDLSTAGNYILSASNNAPGGGNAQVTYPVWLTLNDSTSGMTFSMPVLGTNTTVESDSDGAGDFSVRPYVLLSGATTPTSPFGFYVQPNPLQLSITQWFEANIDYKGVLIASGAYTPQALSDGSTALVLNPAVGIPDSYESSVTGVEQFQNVYKASGTHVVSLFTPQDIFAYPDPNMDIGQMMFDSLATVRF